MLDGNNNNSNDNNNNNNDNYRGYTCRAEFITKHSFEMDARDEDRSEPEINASYLKDDTQIMGKMDESKWIVTEAKIANKARTETRCNNKV